MLENGSGSIVNVGSGGEFGAARGMSWYLSAKHGTYGMTKCAALDYAADGIRINALGPGVMWTPALRTSAAKDPAHLDRLMGINPMRRFAEPEEVAEAAVWLCSDKASFVLGHTLVADGAAGLG
jgi:NAD(P)-dependent dehydrogenase (short-subunit alcohol dehydrogenase family)